MKKLKVKYDYDYIEIELKLHSILYPFFPPKIDYIKPKLKTELVFNILNLNIFKMENWNPTISLEWFIINLGKKLEPLLSEHIILENNNNSEYEQSKGILDRYLMKLALLSKEKAYEWLDLSFDITKINFKNNIKSEYWKAGVGYGYGNKSNWDITQYLKNQEKDMEEIIDILEMINKVLEYQIDIPSEIYFKSVLPTYIKNQLRGVSLLDIQKKESLYKIIFKILYSLTLLEKKPPLGFINEIYEMIEIIVDDVNILINSYSETEETINKDFYMNILCTIEWYGKYYIKKNINKKFLSTSKDKYLQLVKEEQFKNFNITNSHRFVKYKNETVNNKTMLRIASEISTFRTGLPINWDSSILIRISEQYMNLLSFIITGPKDTPYHNGIFEFHAYFPLNYPLKVPKVLLETTGGGNVRFNPNLYKNGKVCLSLLGTWSGQKGESWNKDTSTFLQVLISIQSLILVDEPYYNEPSYERQMNTATGNKKSFDYKDNIRFQTIKWGIIDKIKNPPKSYEKFIKEHFRLKKTEIINITGKWVEESIKRKELLTNIRNKMICLFDTL